MKFREICDEKKDIFLFVLSDNICRIIIRTITGKSKSAIEISNEEGISLASVYRRLNILLNSKIVTASGVISHDGKKIFFYRSNISEIQMLFDIRGIKVKIFNKCEQY
ncbi:hypothetical protein YTPLAS73_07870 [Nitrosarchaeum sp.]|nr:hypothetical protein YTPLAS73_07870 [Nitrosarchaeum sp.]